METVKIETEHGEELYVNKSCIVTLEQITPNKVKVRYMTYRIDFGIYKGKVEDIIS